MVLEDAISQLFANTAEAEELVEVFQDQMDKVSAANRKLAQLAASFTGAGWQGTV